MKFYILTHDVEIVCSYYLWCNFRNCWSADEVDKIADYLEKDTGCDVNMKK